jgi:hypothetical protein
MKITQTSTARPFLYVDCTCEGKWPSLRSATVLSKTAKLENPNENNVLPV